ncbi:MAG: nucleotidyl transferase AbiEii/AbiGii toxin family protein [Niabella sp.]
MSANTDMIIKVAKGLSHLKDEVVFVGGAVAELYADDPAASEIRPTKDVDCVVEISTRNDYYLLEETLRKLGFVNDQSKSAPICRWIFEDIIVDIMPTDDKILGFSNKWYEAGIANKETKLLNGNFEINVFPIEYYLASKYEAMIGRGGNDLRTSHDFEDIIYLMDNSTILLDAIANTTNHELLKYLAAQCRGLMNNKNIKENITSALPYDMEERTSIIEKIIEKISKLTD